MPKSGERTGGLGFILKNPANRIYFREKFLGIARPLTHAWVWAYRRFVIPRSRVIAVIGSVGKTTTSRLLRDALGTDCAFDSHNPVTGVNRPILATRPWHRYCVAEAGIDGYGQMKPMAYMIKPDIVLITAIASDHRRTFPSLEDTRDEKAHMIRGLNEKHTVVMNGDDAHVRWMGTQTRARRVTFGFNEGNDFRAVGIEMDGSGTSFTLKAPGLERRVVTRLLGEHMVYCVLSALTLIILEGLDIDGAIQRVSRTAPTPARMELVAASNGASIIRDYYKASIESMFGALHAMMKIKASRKIVIMSELEEPPPNKAVAYRSVGAHAAAFADKIIFIGGSEVSRVRTGAKSAGMKPDDFIYVKDSVYEAIEIIKKEIKPGDLVLIKGRRTSRFDRISLALEGKDVACRLVYCDLRNYLCDHCPNLTKK